MLHLGPNADIQFKLSQVTLLEKVLIILQNIGICATMSKLKQVMQ